MSESEKLLERTEKQLETASSDVKLAFGTTRYSHDHDT